MPNPSIRHRIRSDIVWIDSVYFPMEGFVSQSISLRVFSVLVVEVEGWVGLLHEVIALIELSAGDGLEGGLESSKGLDVVFSLFQLPNWNSVWRGRMRLNHHGRQRGSGRGCRSRCRRWNRPLNFFSTLDLLTRSSFILGGRARVLTPLTLGGRIFSAFNSPKREVAERNPDCSSA